MRRCGARAGIVGMICGNRAGVARNVVRLLKIVSDMSIRLIQLRRGAERRLGFVEEPRVRLFEGFRSVYALTQAALESGRGVADVMEDDLGDELLDYEGIYNGKSEWKILPAIDHPEPARCVISGTGLTHLGSAQNRSAMHEKIAGREEDLTDSMKMFRWGVEQGKPVDGKIGIAPEWFYKGNGSLLRGHGDGLEVPPYAEDGGEEAEIVGVYVIDGAGNPVRVGMCQGNEFSDHVFERKNYLNLAGSKMRTSSIGPELVIHPAFVSVAGEAAVLREGKVLWSKPLVTGEQEMCHSLANMEHHHFKFGVHRRPGDVHVHFFGTSALSYGDGVRLRDGDVMQVHFEGFGRALRNPVRVAEGADAMVAVRALP